MFRKPSTLSIDFFLFGLIIFGFIIALSLGFWLQFYRSEVEKKQSQLSADALRIENVLVDAFDSVSQYVEFLGIKIVQNQQPGDLPYIADLIGGKQKGKVPEHNFFFTTTFDWVTPDKMLRISSKMGVLPQAFDMRDRAYLNRTEETPWTLHLAEPRVGGLSGRWIIPAGMGVMRDGKFLGTITLGFALESMAKKIDQAKGKTDIHYLVVSRNFEPILYSEGAASTQDLVSAKEGAEDWKQGKELLKNAVGKRQGYLKTPVAFQNVNFSYVLDMESYPFLILAGYHTDMEAALFRRIVLSRMLELSLIGCIAIFMLYMMQRRLIHPITKLAKGADAINRGKAFNWPRSNILEVNRLGEELQKIALHLESERRFMQELETKNEELEKTTREAKEACEAAVRANQAKSDFLANMSHELRTPMNAVIGLTNILLMKDTPPSRQKDLLSTIQLSGQHLMQLINDLLDLAKLENTQLQLEHVTFDINEVVREVRTINAVRAEEKGIKLYLKELRPCQEHILGDPLRLEQVLMNIVGNAIKFTEKGSVTIEMDCNKHTASGTVDVSIAVIDTGIGIPENKRESIFHKFTQADSSTTRKYGGTGLGLSISKALVEAMHGKLWVEGVPDGGSKFMITLSFPIAPAQPQHITPRAAPSSIPIRKPASIQTGASLPAKKENDDKQSLRLLVAEDHKDNVLVLTSFLERMGHRFELAKTGQEAIAKLESGDFDAVLMDIQMPEMDGLLATRHIRQREKETRRAAIPIIGITAYALEGDRERCLAAGMNHYLPKPLSLEQLESVLELYTSTPTIPRREVA